MFGFIKKCFFTGLVFLLTLTSVDSLNCILMNNQECKVRLQIFNVNEDAAVVAPISIIHSQNCVFLML